MKKKHIHTERKIDHEIDTKTESDRRRSRKTETQRPKEPAFTKFSYLSLGNGTSSFCLILFLRTQNPVSRKEALTKCVP